MVWSGTNKLKISQWDTWKSLNLTLDYACSAILIVMLTSLTHYMWSHSNDLSQCQIPYTNGLFALKFPLCTIVFHSVFQDRRVYVLTIYVNQAIHKMRVCTTIFIRNTSLTHVSRNANQKPIHGWQWTKNLWPYYRALVHFRATRKNDFRLKMSRCAA